MVGALAVAWLIRPPASRPSGEELYAAFIGIALLLHGRALLVLLTRPFGAQAARALLNGGEVDRGPNAYIERPVAAADRTIRWPLGSARDVITLENRVHELCGVPLPRRFPHDLVFTGWHLAVVGALVFVALGLALDGAGRVYLVLGIVGLLCARSSTSDRIDNEA